jgi:hypothetical protein
MLWHVEIEMGPIEAVPRHTYILSRPKLTVPQAFIVQALLQAEQDSPKEVVFRATCATCRPNFYWQINGIPGFCCVDMPPQIDPMQVRATLASMTGLDDSRPYPKESELILELLDSEEADFDPPAFLVGHWLVSLASSDGPITLRRHIQITVQR